MDASNYLHSSQAAMVTYAPEVNADYGVKSEIKSSHKQDAIHHDDKRHAGYKVASHILPSPHPPPPLVPESADAETVFDICAHITTEEAREALLGFTADKCCHSKAVARNMEVMTIRPTNAFEYILETFCEGRVLSEAEVPYFGGMLDGAENDRPPSPWSVECSPSQPFIDEVVKLPVPHTDEVQTCKLCHGQRFLSCQECDGNGRSMCLCCNGRGHIMDDEEHHRYHRCTWCDGSGLRKCSECEAEGRVKCDHCEGTGLVKSYIQLSIHYRNYAADYILEQTDMPDDFIQDVQGIQIFQQTLPQVYPLQSFPVQEINSNSRRLIDQAREAHANERQILQRQTLRTVPVSEVEFKYKNHTSRFWIYGIKKRVHCPNYPQRHCVGCNVL